MSKEGGGPSPFTPRSALARSPPSATDQRTSPAVPSRPAVPVPETPKNPAPAPGKPPAGTATPAGGKRPLTSPEERRQDDVVRMCRPVVSPPRQPQSAPPSRSVSPAAPPAEVPSKAPPKTTPAAAPMTPASQEEESPIASASKAQLISRVNDDLAAIMTACTAHPSKLNKDSTNLISEKIRDTLAVVAALSLRLCDVESDLSRQKVKYAELERDLLLAKSSPDVRFDVPGHAVPTKPTYSSALKLSRKADPIPIPEAHGPVLAFYPADNQSGTLKTADDTKAELKRSINPRIIEVQIDRVRKVGNAGVIVQTTTPEAAERLKRAVPPSLRVVEPRQPMPRICVRDVDWSPSPEDWIEVMLENLQGTDWTAARLREDMKMFKMNGRQAGTTNIVMECSPELRNYLVRKGKLYIGWQAVEICDFIRVTCCNKCQMFGHPEKYCRSQEDICGKCGDSGHRRDACIVEKARCATCHRFGRESDSHTTNARTCPARQYAEQRYVSNTNYACP